MPLFAIKEDRLLPIEKKNFPLEKDLQNLVEGNLVALFNCRFVASEFSTGAQHAGRIDTLALSEEDNPVIIEYKKVESSDLINQSLFYLHWIQDHKGDFEIAVQKALGKGTNVDWSDVRVICIAPNYKKFDLHAVQVMGANIELWKYRVFKNNALYLEDVFHASVSSTPTPTPTENTGKDPVRVAAGKKAAQTRATATYTFDEHVKGKPKPIQELMHLIREYILGLDSSMKEFLRKKIIAYGMSQNIVRMRPMKRHIKLFLKLKPSEVTDPPGTFRDVSNIYHRLGMDVEFTVSTEAEFSEMKHFIEAAYQKVGG